MPRYPLLSVPCLEPSGASNSRKHLVVCKCVSGRLTVVCVEARVPVREHAGVRIVRQPLLESMKTKYKHGTDMM